jgi:FlaA1/EpsC-like NDP-sugar epimerase
MAISKSKIKRPQHESILLRSLRLIPRGRALLAFAHDVLVGALAWGFAYQLRFNLAIPHEFVLGMWQTLLWVVPLQAIIFIVFGLYRGVWRFASIPDLKRILRAIAVATLIVIALLAMLHLTTPVPRSVLLLDPILLLMMMGGSRFAYRAWKEHRLYGLTQMRGA